MAAQFEEHSNDMALSLERFPLMPILNLIRNLLLGNFYAIRQKSVIIKYAPPTTHHTKSTTGPLGKLPDISIISGMIDQSHVMQPFVVKCRVRVPQIEFLNY